MSGSELLIHHHVIILDQHVLYEYSRFGRVGLELPIRFGINLSPSTVPQSIASYDTED